MHKKYVRFKRGLNRRKRAAQNSAERRVDREGVGQGRDTERAFAVIKETFSRKTERLLFCGESQTIEGTVGVCRGRRRSSEKREERRAVRALLRTEKAKAESFECGSAASGRHKKFRPSAAEASAQLRCKKLKKAMGALLFCAWFFGTAVGCRGYFLNAEVPFRRTLQNKRVGAKSSNGRATRALRIPQGQK